MFSLGPRRGNWTPSSGTLSKEQGPSRCPCPSHFQIFPDDLYFHLRHRGVAQKSLTPHWGHRLRLKKEPKVSEPMAAIEGEPAAFRQSGSCYERPVGLRGGACLGKSWMSMASHTTWHSGGRGGSYWWAPRRFSRMDVLGHCSFPAPSPEM